MTIERALPRSDRRGPCTFSPRSQASPAVIRIVSVYSLVLNAVLADLDARIAPLEHEIEGVLAERMRKHRKYLHAGQSAFCVQLSAYCFLLGQIYHLTVVGEKPPEE